VKRLWIFRSNIRDLEYYHHLKGSHNFKHECHDFYLQMGIHYLENGDFDEVVVWRLCHPGKTLPTKIYPYGNGEFKQCWVQTFDVCALYDKPDMTFFRGGFKEYCNVTKKIKLLGTTLYCGTGQRVTPQYGGHYDKILVEDERDLQKVPDSVPFYKTAHPNIFKPVEATNKYDICWPANFTQNRYKGQEFFIRKISESEYLKSLKILHTGNKPEEGRRLCKKYGVKNIEFAGWLNRQKLNKRLNQSKFGLVCSNQRDGCPRIVTEILASGTPLLLRETTRLLDYFKSSSVYVFEDMNIESQIKEAMDNYEDFKSTTKNTRKLISMKFICDLNIKNWVA